MILAVVLASLGIWGVLSAGLYRARLGTGLLATVLPVCLLLAPAVEVALSGRDFTLSYAELQLQQQFESSTPFLVELTGLLMTGLLLVASAEALLSGLREPDRLRGVTGVVLVTYVAYWLTNVASPSLLSVHGTFTHDFLYPLAIGGAVILMGPRDADTLVRSTRTGIVLLVLASFGFMLLRPGLVLDFSYSAGLLPGLPRFNGLTPHPTLLAGLCVTGLLCLWVVPYRRRSLTVVSAALLLCALFIAQSKVSWAALPIAALPLLALGAPSGVGGWGNLRFGRMAPALVIGSACLALVVLVASFMTPVGGGVLSDDSMIRSLTTLTGRTEIWRIAYEEWARQPLLGYGSELFGADYREAAGAAYLTSGHNQIMDTLARAGLVGFFGLFLYLTVLVSGGMRRAIPTAGFSVALLAQILLWCMTESPLRLFGYGSVNLPHFALLVVLTSGWRPAARDEGRAEGRVEGRVDERVHGFVPPEVRDSAVR